MQILVDLAYVFGGRSPQKLDLYLPDGGKKWPLIIWIHGGGFRTGSKRDNVPLSYLEQGFAIASLNYRLSKEAIFPAQIEDVKAAVRWLRANAKRYRLDPEHFAAWGESAGAHLAALLGVTGNTDAFEVGDYLETSSTVQAVVDYYGPTDFLQMDTQGQGRGMIHDDPDSPESALVGGPIQMHKDRVATANPISHVSGDARPFLVVHGDRDTLVPWQQSLILHEALCAQGVDSTLYTVIGEGHGYFKDPKVAELTRQFLVKYVKAVPTAGCL
jgi:acetyl esterase/lipase